MSHEICDYPVNMYIGEIVRLKIIIYFTINNTGSEDGTTAVQFLFLGAIFEAKVIKK